MDFCCFGGTRIFFFFLDVSDDGSKRLGEILLILEFMEYILVITPYGDYVYDHDMVIYSLLSSSC